MTQRKFIIDLFIVEQVWKIDNNAPLKGQTYVDPSYLADFQFSDMKILGEMSLVVRLLIIERLYSNS